MSKEKKRFVIADLGFAFAVHDTAEKQEYGFRAGREKEHASSNKLNTERVEIFSNMEEAVRHALEMNKKAG